MISPAASDLICAIVCRGCMVSGRHLEVRRWEGSARRLAACCLCHASGTLGLPMRRVSASLLRALGPYTCSGRTRAAETKAPWHDGKPPPPWAAHTFSIRQCQPKSCTRTQHSGWCRRRHLRSTSTKAGSTSGTRLFAQFFARSYELVSRTLRYSALLADCDISEIHRAK